MYFLISLFKKDKNNFFVFLLAQTNSNNKMREFLFQVTHLHKHKIKLTLCYKLLHDKFCELTY